jgi:hypothetical protein
MGKKDDNHAGVFLLVMALLFGVAAGELGDGWALNCQPKSVQGTAAKAFCQPLHTPSTVCMCHDGPWPKCQHKAQAGFEMCDLETYTGCLVACGSFIETVVCQEKAMVQCTVVASNLRSFVS